MPEDRTELFELVERHILEVDGLNLMLDRIGVEFGKQALKVGEFPYLGSEDICLVLMIDQVLHGVQAIIDLYGVHQRREEPTLELPLGKGSLAIVNIVEQAAFNFA